MPNLCPPGFHIVCVLNKAFIHLFLISSTPTSGNASQESRDLKTRYHRTDLGGSALSLPPSFSGLSLSHQFTLWAIWLHKQHLFRVLVPKLYHAVLRSSLESLIPCKVSGSATDFCWFLSLSSFQVMLLGKRPCALSTAPLREWMSWQFPRVF